MELQMAQKYHGKFKVSRQFQFTHGNLNLLTAISIYLRQFQFYSRQFQFTYAISILLTAISIYSWQFQFTYDHLRQFITSRKVDFRARTRDP